ncbi:hypothetical protein [Spongiibacter marinus]|uniref:hypothetical protein n=1 Tax=Spongiibacter marinus TaxID=354246 RepID=UPI003C556D89
MPTAFPLLFMLAVSAPVAAETPTAQPPIERWSAAVRPASEPAIAQWPCDRLSEVTVASDKQQRQLRERKKQCLQRYQQFIPATGLR